MNTKEKPTRHARKLTVEIINENELAEAYPEVMQEVKIIKADREKLYPIVKAMHAIGRQVPGVKAYYAADTASEDEEADSATETAQTSEEGAAEGGECLPAAKARARAKGAA